MNEAAATGRVALAIGACAAGSAVCLATYFGVGGPFGTINDIGNAATGLLSGWLAWRLRRGTRGRSIDLATGAAMVGAALTIIGSTLVVSRTTGFLFAGFVSSLGFAGIGAWLLNLNRDVALTARWPVRLRQLGVAAGALMALGVAATPAILLGIDDMATAPRWIWIGLSGWVGIFLVYPAWAIWFGMVQRGRSSQAFPAPGRSDA